MGFSEIIGQDRAVSILRRLWSAGKQPQFMLFLGMPGVGRKLAAVSYAQALLCENPDKSKGACGVCKTCNLVEKGGHPDCMVIDFSYQQKMRKKDSSGLHLTIDTLRETVSLLRRRPFSGSCSICLVDGAEDLTIPAQVSLLKILEEAPGHLCWIWIAVSEDRLLPTIVSRANFKVYFQPLDEDSLASVLIKRFGLGEEQARPAARMSRGSLERAQIIMEKKSVKASAAGPAVSWTPAQALTLSQRIARFRNLASARKDVGEFLEELELELLWLWRDKPSPQQLGRLEALLKARQDIEANVTPALVLEHLLLKLG